MNAIFRASSFGNLMSYPEKDKIPDGAITIIDNMVSQKLLNWRDAPLDVNTVEKGKQCENESIEIYNQLHDTFYMKNVERINCGLFTGECDIIDHDNSLVVDIKTSYSKKTHPINLKMSKLYEWQLRVYMYLYNVNHAELAYCLVDTPPELINFKDPDHWHEGIHEIDLKLRVRTLRIERDMVKESQMLQRAKICHEYYIKQLELLK